MDEERLLQRVRRIEDYLAQVGQHIGIPFDIGGSDLPPGVMDLVRDGNKLEAMRILAEERGLGLREARDIVDGL